MKRTYVIGLLLYLSHIAHGFVLLTANIEDIKKLARKFVSESLTEKIADFIAKATEQMVANVSEENDRNENRYQDISKENTDVYNVARQRNQNEPQRYHKKEIPRKPMKLFKAKKPIVKPKKPVRVNLKNRQMDVQNLSKKELEKSYKYPKQYSYSINPKIKKPKPTEIPHIDSTIGIAEKMQPEKDVPKIYEPKLSPNRFRLTANSKETLPNDFENIQKVLTTRKEKNEFDQYDNTKYTKAEYVATSGPVVLPKIPSQDWWDKEDKKRNKDWD